jgi:hypothetical protein
MRHNAEHEGTGRRTGAIDNDLFTGVAKGHVARPISADIAAAIICYADNGEGILRQPAHCYPGERYCERDAQRKYKFTVDDASNRILCRQNI